MKRDFGGIQDHDQPHIFRQKVTFSKPMVGPGSLASPIWSLAPQQGLCDPDYAHFFFEDFNEFVSADIWTASCDTTGSVEVGDGKGGIFTLTTHSDDNDAAWLTSTKELWAIDSTAKIYFEASIQYAEAATDDANIFVGLTADTAATAVPMQAAGAGPTAVDHIGFWKVDGGTLWQYGTSDGSTQDTGSTGVTAGGASYVKLGFIADVNRVQFYINGVLVATTTDVADIPDTDMHIVFHVKAGGAHAEVLLVDWVKCVAIR